MLRQEALEMALLAVGDIDMKRKFPSYLSQPFMILSFELDDVLFFFMSIIVAQSLGGFFWLLPIVVPFVLVKVKKNAPRGFTKHLMYNLGLVEMKYYPIAFEKEFVE